jgi:hypothetical protein
MQDIKMTGNHVYGQVNLGLTAVRTSAVTRDLGNCVPVELPKEKIIRICLMLLLILSATKEWALREEEKNGTLLGSDDWFILLKQETILFSLHYFLRY